MSIEIKAKIICDGCGDVIEGPVCDRSSLPWESYYHAKTKATKRKWITTDHGRFYKNRHFCPVCADKPLPRLKPLKKKR